MTPHPNDPYACALQAYGVAKVPFTEIPALRKVPGPLGGRKIAPSLLKHADPQTILGLAAILQAIDDFGWADRSFEGWGMIAAPRFIGRLMAAAVIDRYKRVGVSGVSPLLIPTVSLNAISGALSLALKTKGFNYGVGGGNGHLAEALLAGLAARDDCGVPGVWVVATQISPEPVPDLVGQCTNDCVGYAVALAITPAGASTSRLNLRVVPTAALADDLSIDPDTELPALTNFLHASTTSGRQRRWFCPVMGVGAIEFDDDPARVRKTKVAGRAAG